MNWNTPLINGFPGQPFISKESFKLYSISPDYELMDLDWLPDFDVDQPTVEPVREATKEKSHVKNDKTIKQKRLPQPFSALTSDQQMKYLELCLKYRFNKPTNHEEQKELSMLKELQGVVSAEQREFMTYLRNLAELNAENYLQMFSPAENYINSYIANLKERVRSYPQYYVSYNAVNFAPTPESQITNIFYRKNLLLEMGQVSRALLPTLEKSKCFLPRNLSKLKKANNGPHKEVSRDGNVDKLAELVEADMAMSYAALECLFDNHAPHFDRQWELPLTVKRDSRGRKLVIIDDPFVAKEMTVPEKNRMFHDILLKSFLIHPNHKNFFDLDTRSENLGNLKDRIWDDTEEAEGDGEGDKRCLKEHFESLFEGNHLTDLERGVISDIPSTSEEFSRSVVVEEDSSDAENLVIDAFGDGPPSPIVSYDGQNDEKPPQKGSNVSGQAILQNPAKKMKIEPQSAQSLQKSNLLDAILEQQSMMLSSAPNGQGREVPTNVHNPEQHLSLQFNNQPVVTCDGYERPTERNVSYSLWMMGKLNVVLKDHYHGYVKIKKFGSCFIDLFTKMEYQKSHGFEQLSESELSRMWLALQMKPSIKNILLGRVDAFTSEFLKHEKVMRENLNWNFNKCLQQLQVILKTCGELDFGSFLISHTQGSKNFQIKKTTNNQNGAYNLYLAYEQAEVKLSAHKTFERHWLPIDLNVSGKFTPVSRIPCTFEPRDTKKSNNIKSKKKKK